VYRPDPKIGVKPYVTRWAMRWHGLTNGVNCVADASDT
jgi:hypothetical protein